MIPDLLLPRVPPIWGYLTCSSLVFPWADNTRPVTPPCSPDLRIPDLFLPSITLSWQYPTCSRELVVDLLLEVRAELDFDLVPRGAAAVVARDYNIEAVGLGEGGGGGKELGDRGADGTVPSLGTVRRARVGLCKHYTTTKLNTQTKQAQFLAWGPYTLSRETVSQVNEHKVKCQRKSGQFGYFCQSLSNICQYAECK